MQSTLAIFRHLAASTPPLVPDELLETMRRGLDYFESHPDSTLDQLERVMCAYGYELWPYNQAFKEEMLAAEERVGERFLLSHLSATGVKSYRAFKEHGGTLSALRAGNVGSFTIEERADLCTALVAVHRDVRGFAVQHVLGAGKARYKQRIEFFRERLKKMHHHIEQLRHLADHEHDHPELSREMREHIRAFEQGLCLLGPELSYDAVCSSVDYFVGRQKHVRQFKYLYQPLSRLV